MHDGTHEMFERKVANGEVHRIYLCEKKSEKIDLKKNKESIYEDVDCLLSWPVYEISNS